MSGSSPLSGAGSSTTRAADLLYYAMLYKTLHKNKSIGGGMAYIENRRTSNIKHSEHYKPQLSQPLIVLWAALLWKHQLDETLFWL